MDMLVGAIFVLVLGLAVAQFFIMSGAFKGGRKPRGSAGAEAGPVLMDAGGTHKSGKGGGKDHDSSDSTDSGGDGGGDGGGGGGE
jgi:hypothetical protein